LIPRRRTSPANARLAERYYRLYMASAAADRDALHEIRPS
jgi:hypothetical protein